LQTPAENRQDAAALRKKPRRAGTAECLLGIAVGVTGLALSRAGQLWVSFDVFAQFTLHFVILTAAFTVGFLMRRGRRLVSLLLLLAGVVALGAWPHIASRSPHVLAEPQAGERALRVASFNSLWINEDHARVRAEIERLDADIVTLIEMSPAKRGILAELRSRYPYQADCFAADFCSLAILSKLPIVESEGRGGWEGPPFIRARLGPEAGGLTVIGVHTIRFPHSSVQFRQANAIGALIENLPGHKLVMGDFNATPFSRIPKVVEVRGNLRRITYLPSWPAAFGLPQIAIDHIFLSPAVRLLERAAIGEAAGSDHFPVTARIGVPLTP
jgi:endonuclease/exonuclease/phosphatase (EEP) superfamily protein YafD